MFDGCLAQLRGRGCTAASSTSLRQAMDNGHRRFRRAVADSALNSVARARCSQRRLMPVSLMVMLGKAKTLKGPD